MQLRDLLPRGNYQHSDSFMQEFLRNLITLPNFVPALRYYLGWRGLKEITGGPEAWTMKIEGYKGIFGLYPAETSSPPNAVTGAFTICYFPDPGEEMIEKISVQAGIITQQQNYLDLVRTFTAHQEMAEHFSLGILYLAVHPGGNWCSAGIDTLQRVRMINQQGVYLIINGERKEVVSPGELEEDIPSLEPVHALFEVISASLSSLLSVPPARYSFFTEPGILKIIDRDGQLHEYPDDEVSRWNINLEWGETLPIIDGGKADIIWEGGDPRPEPDARWWNSHNAYYGTSMDKKVLGIDDRPELIVLSGFLGSGKTTFLNHFVEYQQQFNRFTAIIQNELGEKGVDTRLLDSDFAVLELDEGCVCCTLVGNLKGGISNLIQEFHPDYIVLETTGAANPSNLLDEIVELQDLVRFDSVTTIVDSVNIETTLENFRISRDQIHAADIIILNKVESLNQEEVEGVRELVKKYNPDAPVVPASYGEVNPALLYSYERVPAGGGNCREGHQHTHDMDGLESMTLEVKGILSRSMLIEFLNTLPSSVFRLKGIVSLEDEGNVLVQYVSGRYELSKHDGHVDWPFLTVIGRNVFTTFNRASGFEFVQACV